MPNIRRVFDGPSPESGEFRALTKLVSQERCVVRPVGHRAQVTRGRLRANSDATQSIRVGTHIRVDDLVLGHRRRVADDHAIRTAGRDFEEAGEGLLEGPRFAIAKTALSEGVDCDKAIPAEDVSEFAKELHRHQV